MERMESLSQKYRDQNGQQPSQLPTFGVVSQLFVINGVDNHKAVVLFMTKDRAEAFVRSIPDDPPTVLEMTSLEVLGCLRERWKEGARWLILDPLPPDQPGGARGLRIELAPFVNT